MDYTSVQLGAEKVSPPKIRNVSKPLKGHFAKAQVEPRRYIAESRITEKEEYKIGQEIGVEYFSDAGFVDVTGMTKGKGFQGVIKRHKFSGGPASHGSGFHRTHGSTGMRTSPGRTLSRNENGGTYG